MFLLIFKSVYFSCLHFFYILCLYVKIRARLSQSIVTIFCICVDSQCIHFSDIAYFLSVYRSVGLDMSVKLSFRDIQYFSLFSAFSSFMSLSSLIDLSVFHVACLSRF